ncbi:hypothetical protein Xmau_03953 [Xenorhabdus mauleonii]|uniref:DUF3828 domain-containing protein n=1 Tax=Xenorhabdus mauleonii TaxID=351675 RepID=A0A1I3QU77_9GAMM|nr:DUF3828 domain-containing protein [Xenorhabdus mauleonii]PHM37259.1 hypothetical protein Xmau_03953 [Xenorhabdus mauleonii]SFJ37039.1 Protein of unknown function [Xenorhabdus mauleonii]
MFLFGQATAYAESEQQSPEEVAKEFYIWHMQKSDTPRKLSQNKLKEYVSESLLKKIDDATSCNEPGDYDDCGSTEVEYGVNYYVKAQDIYDYWLNVDVIPLSKTETVAKTKVILGKVSGHPNYLLVTLEKENKSWKIVSVRSFHR